MSSTNHNPLSDFAWEPQPQAYALVRRLIDDFTHRCAAAQDLTQRMRDWTGTRFIDWVDTIMLAADTALRQELADAGFVPAAACGGVGIEALANPKGIFPCIAFHRRAITRVLIKVDSVADFAAANDWCAGPIQGPPLSAYRTCVAEREGDAALLVIERHGHRGLDAPPRDAEAGARDLAAAECLEILRRRPRHFDDEPRGYAVAEAMLRDVIARVGVDRACDLFFIAEREYWQRRNRAAQAQKSRQNRLGLGWGNHDHHTYRCSRQNFARLIHVWELLGFKPRERYYAGLEAGWGAQIMEQPIAGIVTFNDVDLSPQELSADFSHEPLSVRDTLGTVGLWCGLHGDSFLQAGMHHLECQFDFDALTQQLGQECGIGVMKPFSDFPYLRQAFTEGERWTVLPRRIDRLLERGQITPEQAVQFRDQGSIGSHLENLQRNDGFKGFNRQGVSQIIAATDPRRHLAGA
jgi:hypothetical protein